LRNHLTRPVLHWCLAERRNLHNAPFRGAGRCHVLMEWLVLLGRPQLRWRHVVWRHVVWRHVVGPLSAAGADAHCWISNLIHELPTRSLRVYHQHQWPRMAGPHHAACLWPLSSATSCVTDRLARCSKSNLSFRRRLRDDGVTILHRVVIGWCWHARCRVPVALSCGLVHHFDEAAIDGRKAEACRRRVRANRHATYHRENRRASHWRSSSHER
jgi:hypothetical protein